MRSTIGPAPGRAGTSGRERARFWPWPGRRRTLQLAVRPPSRRRRRRNRLRARRRPTAGQPRPMRRGLRLPGRVRGRRIRCRAACRARAGRPWWTRRSRRSRSLFRREGTPLAGARAHAVRSRRSRSQRCKPLCRRQRRNERLSGRPDGLRPGPRLWPPHCGPARLAAAV